MTSMEYERDAGEHCVTLTLKLESDAADATARSQE